MIRVDLCTRQAISGISRFQNPNSGIFNHHSQLECIHAYKENLTWQQMSLQLCQLILRSIEEVSIQLQSGKGNLPCPRYQLAQTRA
jgi:hypothetical protein